MAPRGSSRHRPVFHAVTLAIGFVVGGAMTQVARKFLPAGAVKEFFTTSVQPSVGPVSLDLVILNFSLCPVALDVILLSLFGVLIAYLIARSLF
ncbi:hypothetical protein BH11GEM1_BH11GEM1_21090 [soil metagenome]